MVFNAISISKRFAAPVDKIIGLFVSAIFFKNGMMYVKNFFLKFVNLFSKKKNNEKLDQEEKQD